MEALGTGVAELVLKIICLQVKDSVASERHRVSVTIIL